MKKLWGFTAEIDSFKASSLYDVDDNVLILLPSPFVFKHGKFINPLEKSKESPITKSLTEDYGFLTNEMTIADPIQQDRIDIAAWLKDQGYEGKVQLRTYFEPCDNGLKCFTEFYFNSISEALPFKFAFGDYGIKPIDSQG